MSQYLSMSHSSGSQTALLPAREEVLLSGSGLRDAHGQSLV